MARNFLKKNDKEAEVTPDGALDAALGPDATERPLVDKDNESASDDTNSRSSDSVIDNDSENDEDALSKEIGRPVNKVIYN